MLDYVALQMIWWAILGVIIIVYSTTAGFDFGVTLMLPFLRNEKDRQLALTASMPTWDGNMTWLVFVGGALFVVWPTVYATAFSGLYFAMFAVLWSLFLRPPGFDYRSRIDSPVWRRCWDIALFISALLPVFVFGVGMMNCFLGFPFQFDHLTMREFYMGSFWQLFSGYAILGGLLSVSMIVMHGAAFLQRRVTGPLHDTASYVHLIFSILTFVLFTLLLIIVAMYLPGYHLSYSPVNATAHPLANVVQYMKSGWADSYHLYPWKYYPLIIFYFSIVISIWANYLRALATSFWCSAFAIGGIIGSAGATLFPFIMPSSIKPNQSLTIYNATSSEYSLRTMLYVGVFLLIIILCYKIFAYYSVWHKKPQIDYDDIVEY